MLCKPFTNPSSGESVDRNRITYSELSNLELTGYELPTYSIKYVCRGTEHYELQNRHYAVSKGNYLLVNKYQRSDVFIKSKKPVAGFCLHLTEHLLQKVFTELNRPADSSLDNPFDLKSIGELETLIYSDQDNGVGKYLRHLVMHFNITERTIDLEENEIFLNLAQQLLGSQNLAGQSGKINILRNSTKKELLRRLSLAKEIMDAHYSDQLDIGSVASKAMLSESHFFRSFKMQYGISPYQYISQKRLKHASALLRGNNHSVTEVAHECGFQDLAAFSKAFRKSYGASPTMSMKFNY